MKKHFIRNYQPQYLPAYLSNGVVGLRVGKIPFLGGTASVNGFVGLDEAEKVEASVFAPYPLSVDIRLAGSWLSQRPDLASFVEQSYDFSCGELLTRFDFRVEDNTAQVEVLTFCSRSLPNLVLQQVSIQVEQAAGITLRAKIEPGGVAGRALEHHNFGLEQNIVDGFLKWESPGSLSRLGIAYQTELIGEDGQRQTPESWDYRGAFVSQYRIAARVGQTYLLRQISGLVPEVMHHEPDRQAIRLVGLGRQRGFEKLRQENQAAWQELWKGRPVLLGAEPRWQDMADAAYFYLHSSIHPSSPCSTGLFGLGQFSNYHYFRGHIFWDIETYVVPPALLTAPASARALLDYRSKHLAAAQKNAALNGYRGLQFPWESSPLRGEEVVPVAATNSFSEHHITLDVALAFAYYAFATGDDIFLKQQTWPVLEGVAEWICSRVTKTKRGYEIKTVTGIDEGIVGIDNNIYTNLAAASVLREARKVASQLGFRPPSAWAAIENSMFIASEPTTNLILQHDRHNPADLSCCPETLAAFFLLNYRPDTAVEQVNSRYYLERAQSLMGNPMVYSFLGVFAARLNDRKLALDLFERGFADYVFESFLQTDEFGKSIPHNNPVGPYMANLGGFLMACLYGLPGLELDAGDPLKWGKRPIIMPEGWDGIEVERIWVHGQPAHLIALHGAERARLKFL